MKEAFDAVLHMYTTSVGYLREHTAPRRKNGGRWERSWEGKKPLSLLFSERSDKLALGTG